MVRQSKENTPSWITENIPQELATSTVFRFDVKMPDGSAISVDMLQTIDIDYELLETQLEQTPSQYVFYANIMAELKAQVSILERKCKARRAMLTQAAIDIAREIGVRSPAADQVKVVIESDEKLNIMEAKLVNAQKHANKMHHMCLALQMKSEHLRSLSGFKRQERETQR